MLEKLRKEIDECDKKIIEVLGERMKIAKQVGEYKQKNGLPITNPEREREVIQRAKADAAKLGLNEGTVERIFREIIESAKLCEKK